MLLVSGVQQTDSVIYVHVHAQSLSGVWLFATPWTIAHWLLCPWNSLGKNTGVGDHSLLQGIFLTQGWTPGLPHCRQILYHLSHQQSPWTTSEIPYFFPIKFYPTSHFAQSQSDSKIKKFPRALVWVSSCWAVSPVVEQGGSRGPVFILCSEVLP